MYEERSRQCTSKFDSRIEWKLLQVSENESSTWADDILLLTLFGIFSQ